MRAPKRRLVRRPGEPSTPRRATGAFAARLAGSVVGVAGITLMGAGTFGSPAGAFASTGGEVITGISESCVDAVTTGSLTVSNPVPGDTVTLQVTAHKLGSGTFDPTGATVTITMVSGVTSYPFTISGVPASFSDGTVSGSDGDDTAATDPSGDDYNTWRVQVLSVSGDFSGTDTKTISFDCTGGTATTTSSATTSSTNQTTSTQSTTSSTQSTSSSDTTSSSTSSSSTSSSDTASSSTSSTSQSSSTSSSTSSTSQTSSSSSTSSTVSTPTTTSSGTTSSQTTSSQSSTGQTTTVTDPSTSTSTSDTITVTDPSTSTSTSDTITVTDPSMSTSTVSSSSSSASNPSTGVLGASTTTPSTGADVEFGFGIALLLGGAAAMIGASRINRNKRQ